MSKRAIWVVAILIGFILGNISGFWLGLLTGKAGQTLLTELLSEDVERPADIVHSKTISRKAFSLEYPGNWKVDTADKQYDPDYNFTIDSPGTASVQFYILDQPADPATNVEDQVSVYVPDWIKKPVKTPFSKWGRYTGRGIELKGRIQAYGRGRVRIFSHSSKSSSFTVIEFRYDVDEKEVGPGLKLIEATFQIK